MPEPGDSPRSKIFSCSRVVRLVAMRKPMLAEYAYDFLLKDPYELNQLKILNSCCKTYKYQMLRRFIIRKAVKIQAVARGYIIRRRLKRSMYGLCRNYAARVI